MAFQRLAAVALLLVACGGLSDDDGQEPTPDPAPAKTTEPEPEPTCELGARRCSDEIREVCSQDGWQPIESCVSAARCDPTHCLPE